MHVRAVDMQKSTETKTGLTLCEDDAPWLKLKACFLAIGYAIESPPIKVANYV